MKAIVQDRYGSPGDVLELKEIGKPTVQDDEVLVRVHAATVNWAHWVMVGWGFGLLGHTVSACFGDHRVELVCVKEDGAALTPPLLAVHASVPDLEDTMTVDSQPTDLIVNEAHDASDPTGRGFTRTGITAPAVIGQLVAGLLYLRLAPEDSVTIPTGAQAGDLSLDPCTYQGYEADCGTLAVPETCCSGARVRSSGWGPRSRLTRSQPPRGART